jgi:protoheme ferro-lyase
VNRRAKIICADQLGNQPALREAYAHIIHNQLDKLPSQARILLILSKHGHPFRKETQDKRGAEYRVPLESEMRSLLEKRGGAWDLVWSDDEYADEYWDPRNTKLSTYSAYRMAINDGFDYALKYPRTLLLKTQTL